jgi:exonuclease SbcD
MLILHTADWHLGRIFHGIHLTDDQAYLLAQLEQLIAERKPDVYVISGDIYDRSVPPSSAVELLSDHLTRIVRDLNVPAILIAGNHDSPERLHFGSRLFADNRLHIYGQTEERVRWVELEDKHGPVRFYPVPYADPAMVRYVLGDPSLEDHNGAMRALVDRIVALHPPDMRSVLITHAFAAGGMISESERPLSVGGRSTPRFSSRSISPL